MGGIFKPVGASSGSGSGSVVVSGTSVSIVYQANSNTFPSSPNEGDQVFVTSDGTAAGALKEKWTYINTAWYEEIGSTLYVYNWNLASSYLAGNIVVYQNTQYVANSDIPANTAFVEGSTGATYKLLGAYNAPQFNPATLLFGAF